MPSTPPTRSVKIDQDERGGWSSDRPRRDGRPARPADLSVRSRVLAPSATLRYAPGSLLLIVCAAPAAGEAFAQRVVEDRSSLLSQGKVRGLLAGRVGEDALEARAAEVLEAAVLKRLEANQSVALATKALTREERERFVRPAASQRRPCHLVLVESPRDDVAEEDRLGLNSLRKALDAGSLGGEGFHTALRLGGGSIAEVKRAVFRAEPRDE